MLRVFWVAWEGMSWTPPTLSQFLRKLWITASITAGILIVGAVVVKILSLLARLRESKRAAAAEAAAADLFADNARPGLRRRAHRGRRRGRARETAADEPSATESKPEPPVAPESKSEEPTAAPEDLLTSAGAPRRFQSNRLHAFRSKLVRLGIRERIALRAWVRGAARGARPPRR